MRYVAELRASPVAIATDAANRQHYEVPAAFFERVLGPRLKYSAACWPEGVTPSRTPRRRCCALTVRARAARATGSDILELGCGWGSLSLYMAERFPGARITAVSNSHGAAPLHRRRRAERAGSRNVEVVTADINDFALDRRFDRVVSVEMFEHVRNYEALLERVAAVAGARRRCCSCTSSRTASSPIPTRSRDATDWMARHFFTGGQMPSRRPAPLLPARPATASTHWGVDGTPLREDEQGLAREHGRAATAILLPSSRPPTAPRTARAWWTRWRVFFMACAELFGYRRRTRVDGLALPVRHQSTVTEAGGRAVAAGFRILSRSPVSCINIRGTTMRLQVPRRVLSFSAILCAVLTAALAAQTTARKPAAGRRTPPTAPQAPPATPYTTGTWDADKLGNHRVVLDVPVAANAGPRAHSRGGGATPAPKEEPDPDRRDDGNARRESRPRVDHPRRG